MSVKIGELITHTNNFNFQGYQKKFLTEWIIHYFYLFSITLEFVVTKSLDIQCIQIIYVD